MSMLLWLITCFCFLLFLPFYVEVLSNAVTLGKFKAIKKITDERIKILKKENKNEENEGE